MRRRLLRHGFGADHYRFFRRYGLDDGVTTALTGALLFIVLFYRAYQLADSLELDPTSG